MSCGCLKPKCGTQQAVTFQCDNDGRDVEFIALTEFLPRVTLVAQGVPDDVAVEYLRQAAFHFARDSLLLKRELRFDVQAGVRDYYLSNGDHEQVHYIDEIGFGKSRATCHCRSSPSKGIPCREFQFEPNDKIILANSPKSDGENQLFVRYFAVPTQSACEVDKLLFDRYHDVIVNGALSELLLMRKYDFADPQMAMFYKREYQQGLAKAKIDVARDFNTGSHSFNQWGWI